MCFIVTEPKWERCLEIQKTMLATWLAPWRGTLGTGTGAVVGLLFAAFVLLAYLSVFKRQMKRERRAKVDSYSYIFKILFITIIPVLMSTTIYNCNAILDQAF